MSKYKVPSCELSTIEDIENIPDFETAKKFMKKWKVKTKGVKTKDEAILKLKEFWRARELASVFEEEESRDQSEIQTIKDNVEETKGALHDVLVKIRDRDGKLPLLKRKADDVHRMGKQFKKIAFKARAKRHCRQHKSVIIISSLVILVVIAVVVTTTIIILERGNN